VGRVWPRHGHRGRPLNSVVRQHVQPAWLKLSIVAAGGLMAPLWWTWAVSQLTYLLHLATGPERPSKAMFYAMVFGSSFAIGIAAGVLIAFLTRPNSMKGWIVFFAAMVLSSLSLGLFFGAPVEALGALFGFGGSWFFFGGSILGPAITEVRKRAV
jgi:hypothetical protein